MDNTIHHHHSDLVSSRMRFRLSSLLVLLLYAAKAAAGLAELGELVEGDLSGVEVVEGEVGTFCHFFYYNRRAYGPLSSCRICGTVFPGFILLQIGIFRHY